MLTWMQGKSPQDWLNAKRHVLVKMLQAWGVTTQHDVIG